MTKAKGSAGFDGWSAHEAKVIATVFPQLMRELHER